MNARSLAQDVGLSKEDSRLFREAGCDLLGAGDFDSAADVFKGVLALDPNDALASTAYGMVLRAQGDDAAAATQFDAALRADPGLPLALLNRGIVLLKRGDFSGLDDLNRITDLPSEVGATAREVLKAFTRSS